MKDRLLKFKIKATLILINLFKKAQVLAFLIFKKIGKFLEIFLFLFIKFIILLILPFYRKVKKILEENLSNFYYRTKIFSFFNQRILILICFFLIFILVFFETKVSAQTDFFSQTILKENGSSNFEIASEEVKSEEAVLKPFVTLDQKFIPTRTEIEKYIVEKGDTISSIAEEFGVSVNTILWENNLSPYSVIRPGQVLRILPISGVSHKVKPGDTVEKIAKLYQANKEDIINFNNLDEEPLKVGDIIIIPEGKIPPPPPTPRVFVKKEKIWLSELGQTERKGENCRNFYPGQCTWYIAQKYCIPWAGHAKSWLANAQKYGYSIGKEPKVGAIVSLRGVNTWYGHVALVEEVKDNTIVISEMNYLGPWKVNRREININDWRIIGYIYMR